MTRNVTVFGKWIAGGSVRLDMPLLPDVLPCHSKLPKDTAYTVEKLQGEPTEFPLASVYRFRDKRSLYSAQKFRGVT